MGIMNEIDLELRKCKNCKNFVCLKKQCSINNKEVCEDYELTSEALIKEIDKRAGV